MVDIYVVAQELSMGKRKVLDERAMQLAEALIPALAEYALRRARDRALTLGGTVLEAIDGKLVETSVDASQRFIANLPPATPIRPGSKRLRSRGDGPDIDR
ncbi:hypothetical protein K6V71_18755 [Cupriavidus gilardii]|nr:hypothetical protein [Cupriavidus gilardii]UXC35728.1 hypothetical protein N4G38_15345 [Cupriavidus gilardii]